MQEHMTDEQPRPCIKVAVIKNFAKFEILNDVLSGIEEESVPSEVIYLPNDDAIALAYQAALESVLDVGIGLDSKGNLAVHYKKLPSDTPLFSLNYSTEREKLRSICSNSARLVKGTPFIIV